MLALTRYSNGLYLLLAACAILFTLFANVFLSNADAATRIGGLLGGVGVAAVLGLPYFFSFRASRTLAVIHVKQAMISSTVLLAICALVGAVGLFMDFMLAFAALIWGLPSIFAVNAFKSLPDTGSGQPFSSS